MLSLMGTAVTSLPIINGKRWGPGGVAWLVDASSPCFKRLHVLSIPSQDPDGQQLTDVPVSLKNQWTYPRWELKKERKRKRLAYWGGQKYVYSSHGEGHAGDYCSSFSRAKTSQKESQLQTSFCLLLQLKFRNVFCNLGNSIEYCLKVNCSLFFFVLM